MAITPASRLAGKRPYRVPRAATPMDLYLDGNEGLLPPEGLLQVVQDLTSEALRRYPDAKPLEEMIAHSLGCDPTEVLVTAGADDALDRMARAFLEPRRSLLIAEPTFEMIPRYAELAGGEVKRVDGSGKEFPLSELLRGIDEKTAVVAVISPNNPTGVVAKIEELEQLADACVDQVLLVDHAYVEFCDEDYTPYALKRQNVIVTRTFSKAWGIAGARVGYALGNRELLEVMRAAGNPYAVSSLSLALSSRWFQAGKEQVEDYRALVSEEREDLRGALEECGVEVFPSGGNFLFAQTKDGVWWRDGLAGMGIAIRAFPGVPGGEGAIRIACPGNREDLNRTVDAIRLVGAPEGILFDLDGVFADVSRSYRQAIIETAASFGVAVTGEEIGAIKARGQANNDWRVTQELLEAKQVQVSLEEVTRRFENLYQGSGEKEGLWKEESLLIEKDFLESLESRGLKLAIVTGRPRKDALRFLEHFGLSSFFEVMICMEDGPLKPDPWPVKEALTRLGISRAYFIGDTPDDMRAGRSAKILPLGILAPGEHQEMKSSLLEAGAGRVLDKVEDLLEVLP